MATYNYLNKTGLTKLWTKAKAAFADKESTNTELAKKFELPSGGTTGQILTKTDDGTSWSNPSSGDLEVATDSEFNNFMGITVDPINSPFSALSAISSQVTNENADTYISKYNSYLNKTRAIDLGSYGTGFFQLVGICHDKSPDGNPLLFTYLAKQIITRRTYSNANFTNYSDSEIRTFVTNDIYNSFPDSVKSYMKTASKISSYKSSDFTFQDKLWIPGMIDIFSANSHTDEYYPIFASNNERIRYYEGFVNKWWLNDTTSSYRSFCVTTSGGYSDIPAKNNNTVGIIVGFCI